MTDQKLKIAIIGCGSIAHAHMNNYVKFEDVEVVAAADIVPGKAETFLREYGLSGARAYTDHAALLAKEGFTADERPLEGRFGLLDALCGPGQYDASRLTANLGAPFGLENPGITIKPYPNCWAHHKVLQAVLELREKHAIAPENVERVEVDLQTDKPTYRNAAEYTAFSSSKRHG